MKYLTLYTIVLVNLYTTCLQAQTRADLQHVIARLRGTDKLLADKLSGIRFIKQATFIAGEYEGHDSISFYTACKTTVAPFFISAYEVCNEEYREFTDYVLDSVIKTLLGGAYIITAPDGTQYLDISKNISQADLKTYAAMKWDVQPMTTYKPLTIMRNNKYFINPALAQYYYKDGQIKHEVYVYPDTLSVNNLIEPYYNDPGTWNYYYFHPVFGNYPVTGISYYQALAFCHWKTRQLQKALGSDFDYEVSCSLPTAYEWELAALTNTDTVLYSGNGQWSRQNAVSVQARQLENRPEIMNRKTSKKESRYNFGEVADPNGFILFYSADDGYEATAPVTSFRPNKNGLYNMSGNVAEWTSTAGNMCFITIAGENNRLITPQGITAVTDSFLNKMKKTQVVKGGGWNSNPFYLQPGVNQFYDPAVQRGDIGFRYVLRIVKKD